LGDDPHSILSVIVFRMAKEGARGQLPIRLLAVAALLVSNLPPKVRYIRLSIKSHQFYLTAVAWLHFRTLLPER